MRHIVRNCIRTIGAFCIVLSVIAGAALSAYASDSSGGDVTSPGTSDENVSEESAVTGGNSNDKPLLPVEDLTQDTSLLTAYLVYADEELKKDVPVAGAVIDLYKVADLQTENGAAHYILTEDFASSGIDFEGMTASESLAAAETLNKLVDANSLQPSSTGTVNEQGYVVFSDLEPGMYLGRQRELVRISETKKVTMEPVLWMTPMYVLNDAQDGYVWNYEPEVYPKEGEMEQIPTVTPTLTATPKLTVAPTITPKITITRTPTKTPVPVTSSKTTFVKTGDSSPIGLFVILAIAAIAVIAIVLRKKK